MDNIKIAMLVDLPESIPILKELFITEWEPYYGKNGPGDAEADLQKSARRNELPIALVAVVGNNICGTAALKKESLTTYPDLSPWLAALLVAPEYRKKGIGETLIAAIEELAKKLGYDEIYVGTGEKSGMSVSTLQKYTDMGKYLH